MKKYRRHQKESLNLNIQGMFRQFRWLLGMIVIGPMLVAGQQTGCPPPTIGYVTEQFAVVSPDAVTRISVLSNSPLCAGAPLTLYASCAVGVTYLWTGPNGFTSGAQNPVRPDITMNDAGKYEVTVIFPNGCSGYASTNLIVNQSPAVSVLPSANPVSLGTLVNFIAQVVNGGTMPTLQWYVNNVPVTGATNANYSYIPANNDAVACKATTANGCASTSTPIIMAVTSIPATTVLQNVFVTPGPPVCFNAMQTIFVAGSGTAFMVQPGGNATMIAGSKILYQPFTKVFQGGYMHGYIAPGGPFCSLTKNASIVNVAEGEGEKVPVTDNIFFRIYPNPTTGNFALEWKGAEQHFKLRVEIFNMMGEKVLSQELYGEPMHEFIFDDMPAGLYFIKLTTANYGGTIKLIKSR